MGSDGDMRELEHLVRRYLYASIYMSVVLTIIMALFIYDSVKEHL